MLTQTLTIAINTFRESVRQPIYFIIIALAGLMQLFTTWSTGFSMDLSSSAEVSSDDKLMLDISLATVFVCGTLLAAFLATAVLSREIENRTVLTVVSKPVGRPTVVLGKYLGAAFAIVIAVVTMLMFLQMGLRHGVLSTAADDVDMPVVIFTGAAVLLALGAGVWGNFFYGWAFTQTASLLLCPLMIVAVLLVMLVGKKWELRGVESIGIDFKPQIAMASLCVLMAHLVLTAIATAASARLGQVMTLVVCCAVFLGGLLSNHFLGRRAIENKLVARILEAQPQAIGEAPLTRNGDTYLLTFEEPPRVKIPPLTPFYYGRNSDGLGLANLGTNPDIAALPENERLTSREPPPGMVFTKSDAKGATVRRVGADGQAVSRPPREGDFVFLQPTRINPAALGLWGIIPNIQSFWLVDAVSQNQKIPPSHMGLVALYGLAQIGVFLCLGIILFQKREVG
jgi:hypothetical protein